VASGRRSQDQLSELLVVQTETLGLSTIKDQSINTLEEDGPKRLERPKILELVLKELSGLSELDKKEVASLSSKMMEEDGIRFQDLQQTSVLDQMETLGLLTSKEESTLTTVKNGLSKLEEAKTSELVLMVPSGLLELTKKLVDSVSTEELLSSRLLDNKRSLDQPLELILMDLDSHGLSATKATSGDTMERDGLCTQELLLTLELMLLVKYGSLEPTKKVVVMVSTDGLENQENHQRTVNGKSIQVLV